MFPLLVVTEALMNLPDVEPTVIVSFPDALRTRVGNRRSITVAGHTVREIIDALDNEFPGLRFNLCYETGELRPYVNIFLERENIRYLQGLDTPVTTGVTLHVLQSVAGGE
jgi:sulfur-carrier protein